MYFAAGKGVDSLPLWQSTVPYLPTLFLSFDLFFKLIILIGDDIVAQFKDFGEGPSERTRRLGQELRRACFVHCIGGVFTFGLNEKNEPRDRDEFQ